MTIRKLLLSIFGLMMIVSLSACTEQDVSTQSPSTYYKNDPTWLTVEQQDDFLFRLSLDTPEGEVPSSTITVGPDRAIKLKANLFYMGEEPVEIAYNKQLIYISSIGDPDDKTKTPPLLVHPYDPKTLIKQQMKQGDWTTGENAELLTHAEPGEHTVHGYAAFQVGEKKYRIRTKFNIAVQEK